MANERARRLRRNPTGAEGLLWRRLRRGQLGGHHFRRQAPIGRYIVDFACFEARLAVEVDGGQHALRPGHDARRTAWLESQGFRVVRFWNNEVLQNIEGVIETIAAALPLRPPTPTLPHKGGGS